MRICAARLRVLRNQVPIDDVVAALGIPAKRREGYLRFLCPLCEEFNTATNPRTNLARCFRCKRNFNPIDLVTAAEGRPFLEAVGRVERMLRQFTER